MEINGNDISCVEFDLSEKDIIFDEESQNANKTEDSTQPDAEIEHDSHNNDVKYLQYKDSSEEK